MTEHAHRGAKAPSPFIHAPDRRILELDEALRGVEAFSGAIPGLGLFRDPTRAASAKLQALGKGGQWFRGTVIHPLPSVNWYKVQGGDGAGTIAACFLTHSTLMPLGPRHIGMAGPNDDVLVFKPQGLNFGFIIGVIPPNSIHGSILVPDWIVQGGGSGLRREQGHSYPIKNLFQAGGVLDWSAQRPQDQTPLEQGWITSFGLAITIDDYLIQLRVNEMAGLWLSLFDGWVRLAGEQLLIESTVHEVDAGDDEGEARYFKGIATYPHEALGQYAKGQTFTETNDAKDVQYTNHRGQIDLKKSEEDLQPIYRYREYGGYLGQGHLRTVSCPSKESGSNTYKDKATFDDGLFMESIGLDGSYSVVSAKSLYFGKRCRIVAPKLIEPVTAKKGDDAKTGNYKFSSLFGSGAEHKVGDITTTADIKAMLKVAATLDYISYALNWKAVHPFHYHTGDYKVPQASEGKVLKRTQENIDFSEVDTDFYVQDPIAKKLKIDHRYGQVEFFERESFFIFHDDGSIHLCGGAGEELVLSGGRIFLNAPGGIDIRPGTDFTVHASQAIIKAKGSIDISSTDADVRVKAEKNMQFVAGNSGEGGLLFESKGTGEVQQYENKFGEDVRSSGIVFKAAQSVISLLGKDIYLRTGGKDLGEGDILLDASRGNRRVQIYAKEFHTYSTKAVTFNLGPIDDTSTIRRTYHFGDKTMIADVKLLLGGKLTCYNGGGGNAGIVVDGDISGTGSFATSGTMADKKGMFLGKVPSGFAGTVTSSCNSAVTDLESLKQDAENLHKTSVVQKYYQPEQLGNEDLIKTLQFSFRDPPGEPIQYKTNRFAWPEAHWQRLVRFGMCSGGVAWTEKPVICQDQKTYPWPGKQKLVDEQAFQQLDAFKMFDANKGVDQDRPGPYEQPELGQLELKTLDGQYTLIR